MTERLDRTLWPDVLTIDEVASVLGVSVDAVYRRVLQKRMRPVPFGRSKPRWLREDVIRYLSDPRTVVSDWGRYRRVGDRAEPTEFRPGKVPASAHSIAQLPLVLKLSDMAAVLRLSPGYIRGRVGNSTMFPPPITRKPLRWARFDVERYLHDAVTIERELQSWRDREAAREQRRRQQAEGNVHALMSGLDRTADHLMVGEGSLAVRLLNAWNEHMLKVREVDVPPALLKEWGRMSGRYAPVLIADPPPTSDQCKLAVEAFVKFRRLIRVWWMEEHPDG